MNADPTDPGGRADQIVALFELHGEELLRLAYLLTSDRELAEDLVQEAFVRAWRSWGQLRREASAPAWLRVTLLNLTRSSLRRRLREWRTHVAGQEHSAPDVDPALRIDLDRAVAALPLRRRACIVLRYYADLSERDTAAALGISVGTVKSQTAKALRQLERALSVTGARPSVPPPR
jgi:RNA polymerase sigma-70 factor (sigma-E family)